VSGNSDQVPAAGSHRRWEELIALGGPVTSARTIPDHDLAAPRHARARSTDRQIELREQFIRADPAARRRHDLLCVAVLDRGGDSEIVAFGPQAMRVLAVPTGPGILVGELRLAPASGVRRVSVLVIVAPRRPSLRSLASSIDNLARALDYPRDPIGSQAVADHLLHRIETLMSAPGVEVALAGTTDLDDDGRDIYRLLTAGTREDGHVREGRMMVVDRDGVAAPWRAANFSLLRVGSPQPIRGEIRSIHQLRREHALVEIGFSSGVAVVARESWSDRAARTRRALRAADFVWAALSGDKTAALEIHRSLLTQPDAALDFGANLRRQVDSAAAFWPVNEFLREAASDPQLPQVCRPDAVAMSVSFATHIENLLGLARKPSTSAILPIVFEVSAALWPALDVRIEGEGFLWEEGTGLRERILLETGVLLPPVRARVGDDLRFGEFRVLMNDTAVFIGRAAPDPAAVYAVTPLGLPVPHQLQTTDVDPLTGRRGAWVISQVFVDQPEAGSCLSAAFYLAYCFESALRAHLHRLVDSQQVGDLIQHWLTLTSDANWLEYLSHGSDQQLRLSWALRAVVAEGLTIADFRGIVTAISAAGGFDAPIPQLVAAVRSRLRAAMGLWPMGTLLRVPAEFDARTLHTAEGERRFLRWLAARAVEHGPAITLVSGDEDVRDRVLTLGRAPHRLITACTETDVKWT